MILLCLLHYDVRQTQIQYLLLIDIETKHDNIQLDLGNRQYILKGNGVPVLRNFFWSVSLLVVEASGRVDSKVGCRYVRSIKTTVVSGRKCTDLEVGCLPTLTFSLGFVLDKRTR